MCPHMPQCACGIQRHHHCISSYVLWGQELGWARTSWTASGVRMERLGWPVSGLLVHLASGVQVNPRKCIPKEADIPQIHSHPQPSLACDTICQPPTDPPYSSFRWSRLQGPCLPPPSSPTTTHSGRKWEELRCSFSPHCHFQWPFEDR